MKKIFKFLPLLLCLCMLATVFVACDKDPSTSGSGSGSSGSTGDNPVTITVTYNYNYEGAENGTAQIDVGSKLSKPEDPVRSGFDFYAWYTDENCTSPFDFENTVLNEDITLYANWLESGVTYYTVTLHYNSNVDNASLKVKGGDRLTEPEAVYEGHVFEGWYEDEDLSKVFAFRTKINKNTDLYAKWSKLTTFEAEYLVFDELNGPGYSGASYGTDMIIKDRMEANASNGYYVGYLNASYDSEQYNTTLEFHVTSSVAVSNATLILRLSAEYVDIVLNGDVYEVLCNGRKFAYDDITFTGAAAATENHSLLEFKDYVISTTVSLNAGDNTITLRTNNNIKQGSGGTMNSTAPLVDCIKIGVDTKYNAELSWTDGYWDLNSNKVK